MHINNYHNKLNQKVHSDYLINYIIQKHNDLRNRKLKFHKQEYLKLIGYLKKENGVLKEPYFTKSIDSIDYEIYMWIKKLKDKVFKEYELKTVFNTNYNKWEIWKQQIKRANGDVNQLKHWEAYVAFKDSYLNPVYRTIHRNVDYDIFNVHHILEGFILDEEGYYTFYLSDFIHNIEHYNKQGVHKAENLTIADFIQHLIIHTVILNILMDENKKIAVGDRISLFNEFKDYYESNRTKGFHKSEKCIQYLNQKYNEEIINMIVDIVNYTWERFNNYEYTKYKIKKLNRRR